MTNTVQKPSMRNQLLSVAADLFSAHGYQAVGVRDIAKYLGINPGSIYNHVESKQILLYELIEETLYNLINDTRKHINKKGSHLSRLEKFIQIFFNFNTQYPGQMLVVSREKHNLNPQQKSDISARYTEYLILLEQILRGVLPQHTHHGVPHLARTILAFLFRQLLFQEFALSNISLTEFITRLVLIGGSRQSIMSVESHP
jgi:AcrR family transcriptional regulator